MLSLVEEEPGYEAIVSSVDAVVVSLRVVTPPPVDALRSNSAPSNRRHLCSSSLFPHHSSLLLILRVFHCTQMIHFSYDVRKLSYPHCSRLGKGHLLLFNPGGV